MAKKNNTKPQAAEPIVGLDDEETGSPSLLMDEGANGGALLPATPGVSTLLADRGRLAHELGNVFESTHVGGSLPLINWTREGQSFVGRYLMREAPTEDREYAFLVFDVINTRELAKTKDVSKSVAVRAQLVESTALAPFFSTAKGGELLQLTYVGEVPTKRGQSKLKLITVEALKLRGVAQ
jgi:hypothetical protein